MSWFHPHLRAYLWTLLVIVAIAGFLYELYSLGVGHQSPAAQPQSQTTLPPYPANLPPLRPQDSIGQAPSFQYLVSYSASGFDAKAFSMKAGETVRFFNDSNEQITVMGANAQSPALVYGAYWQYTPAAAGSLTFTAGTSSVLITVAK